MMNLATIDPSLISLMALGVRPIDLAAFVALGLVWIFVLAMLWGIHQILRSKARGDGGWGDSPGL